jgi:hypothetical protein
MGARISKEYSDNVSSSNWRGLTPFETQAARHHGKMQVILDN